MNARHVLELCKTFHTQYNSKWVFNK